MNNEITGKDVLETLTLVHQGGRTGHLSVPEGNGMLCLGLREGKFVSISAKFLDALHLPVNPAGDAGSAPCGDPLAPLCPSKSLAPILTDFLGKLVGDLSRLGVNPMIRFTEGTVVLPAECFPIPVSAILSHVFARTIPLAEVERKIGDQNKRVGLLPDYMGRASKIMLSSQQAFLLTRLQEGLSFRDLVLSSGLPEEQVIRALLLFLSFGIIRELAPAPREKTGPLRGPAPGPPPSPAPAAPARSRETVSTEPPRPAPTLSSPTPAHSPVAPSAAASTTAKFIIVPPELLEEIEDLSLFAGQSDYYALLDVSPHAETGEIKKRFVELTKKFHPDVFQRYGNPELTKKVDTIFAAITEAHETLKDTSKRASYHERFPEFCKPGRVRSAVKSPAPPAAPSAAGPAAGASPGTSPGSAAPPGAPHKEKAYESLEHKAQQHFLHGKDAFKRKQFHEALEHFREAVRVSPEKAEIQYMLGKTLAMNPQKLKEAEERLLKAAELSPKRAEFLIEIAMFYDKVNLKNRARRYYELTLEADPKNAMAKNALGIKDKKPFELKNLMKIDLKSLFKKK
ncbi:MAG: DnaJ domain-containing protein [Acidobacteria bacterium]|nr:DnaJ domain-containing protein [Acidobacteriota bacterium]